MLTLAANTIVTTKSLPPHAVLLLFPPSPPPPAWWHQTFQNFKVPLTIELSFKSMELAIFPLSWFSIACFAYNNDNFLPLVIHTRR